MSNQTPAHVADERAAFEAWASTCDGNCSPENLKMFRGEYISPLVERDWLVWQAARAAIPAGANESDTKGKFTDYVQWCATGKRIPLTYSEFARVIAAGAPAETPKQKPDRDAIHRRVLAMGMDGPELIGPVVCTIPPPGWYCTRVAGHEGPCAAWPAAQPAPAPATDARRLPTLTKMQAIIRKGSLVSNTDAWTIAETVLSMLSDNSPREAG